MHAAVANALREWVASRPIPRHSRVADLGAFNINGSVKDVIPDAVGFDICPGPSVDEVIESGVIPKEHRQVYDAVVSVSTFQFSEPIEFACEVLGLLKPWGWLFLTMCTPSCHEKHISSDGGEDGFRWRKRQLVQFWKPEIKCVRLYTTKGSHEDLVYVGRRVT